MPWGVTKPRDGDIKCPGGVAPNSHGGWRQEPQGYHFLPALSTVSAALSLGGVSSHWVTHVPGAGTVPWTGHLLPGPWPQPHTAPVLRCHLHPASASSSSTPAVTQRGQHPSPPCPTVCGSESPALPRGGGHPPPGQVLLVLACPSRSHGAGVILRRPSGTEDSSGERLGRRGHIPAPARSRELELVIPTGSLPARGVP